QPATRGFELAANVTVVIDLAVEGDDIAAVAGMHGLRAAGAQVDDREPALTDHHAAFCIDPDRTGIGSAMPHGFDHGLADRSQCVGRSCRAPIDHPGYAAHPVNPALSRLEHVVASDSASVQDGDTLRFDNNLSLLGAMKVLFFIRS